VGRVKWNASLVLTYCQALDNLHRAQPPDYGSWRSYPQALSLHLVRPRPRPRPQRPNLTKMSTPSEEKIPSEEELRAVVKESKSPYDQAREYVERFNHWSEGKTPGSLNSYEESFFIRMPVEDWNRLSDDLNIIETDQKSGQSL